MLGGVHGLIERRGVLGVRGGDVQGRDGGRRLLGVPGQHELGGGEHAVTDCTCVAGYTASSNGVACSACGAGTYKPAAGAGICTACPAHTSSAAGSTAAGDCTCLAGYTAETDGVACSACGAGTYKASSRRGQLHGVSGAHELGGGEHGGG